MKAIVQDGYGSADVLELRDIGRPAIGAEEVLVKVRAAGLDPGVWHLMTGQPYLVRAMGFGLRRPKVAVRGRDLAGVVEAGRRALADMPDAIRYLAEGHAAGKVVITI
jgi:NADPH:quinone reductase-like Zn-dependent oxidoreductase